MKAYLEKLKAVYHTDDDVDFVRTCLDKHKDRITKIIDSKLSESKKLSQVASILQREFNTKNIPGARFVFRATPAKDTQNPKWAALGINKGAFGSQKNGKYEIQMEIFPKFLHAYRENFYNLVKTMQEFISHELVHLGQVKDVPDKKFFKTPENGYLGDPYEVQAYAQVIIQELRRALKKHSPATVKKMVQQKIKRLHDERVIPNRYSPVLMMYQKKFDKSDEIWSKLAGHLKKYSEKLL